VGHDAPPNDRRLTVQRLQDKVAIVTGGSQGIGAAIAQRLEDEGATVANADLRTGVDVADEAAVRTFFDQVEAEHERLDLLVNNAGIGTPVARITQTTTEEWERTLRVNLTGTMLCTREAMARMPAHGGGSILNVSSNVGKRGLALRSAYVCSKWAINGLTQTAALEGAEHGIRVNAVLPGNVDTPHLDEVVRLHAEAEGRPLESFAAELKALSPMGRYVGLDEVAAVSAFLLSDEASAMTGQLVNVTAGWIMH
jgi:NAD(P)-dependent dehydrogenase (short-subunit alcohol dehydrogenase family)